MSKRIILANGAFKSGSTWLREIIKEMAPFAAIPPRYADEKYAHWVHLGKLDAFARDESVEGNFLSKSHIYLPSMVKRVLSLECVSVVNIERDIRDVVVSAYYHYKRVNKKENLTFGDYYRRVGRYKAAEVLQYNLSWKIDHPRVLLTSYEALKSDFDGEVGKVADFLGFSVTPDDLSRIRTETSMENLQRKRGEDKRPEAERFFRKGIVGDWTSHFDPSEIVDLENIAKNGLKGLDRMKYLVAFPLRRRITLSILRAKGLFR